MLFVKTYAKLSIVLAILVAIYSAWSLKYPSAGSMSDALMIMTQTIWAMVSVAALLIFPSYRAPLWAPSLFLLFCLSHAIIDFVLALAFPNVTPAGWVTTIKQTPALVHYAGLGFAAALVALNAILLRHRLPTQAEAPKP